MAEKTGTQKNTTDDPMKVTVTKNGPFIVSGGVPLIDEEICTDDEGNGLNWRKTKTYPVQGQYALCRCGHSQNKPFCNGMHAKVMFNGTETAAHEPYLRHPRRVRGPELELHDYENLCVHARFCMRAGGVWNLTGQSGNPKAKETAIEEACNCPSGRLVIRDKESGRAIEPDLEKSIAVIENPERGEHGPLWVKGSIPVISASGKPYTIRNRVTLCRCGKSHNMPFCDGSHVQE